MATQPLRLGILGTAAVASYALIAPARTCPDLAIAAVGSRDPGRARAFADMHGIAAAGDYDEVIDDPAIAAIYVALPNALHAEWSIKALRAGKAVLCEKPSHLQRRRSRSMRGRPDIGRDFPSSRAFIGGITRSRMRLSDIVASGELGAIGTVEVRFRYAIALSQAR